MIPPLPSPKLEAWKFTNFAQAYSLLPEAAASTPTVAELEALLPIFAAPQVVFCNGARVPDLCTPLPQGVSLTDAGPSLCGAPAGALDGLDDLAATHSWRLHIAQTLPQALVVLHIGTHGASKLEISIAESASAICIEAHLAPLGSGWQHHATTVQVAERASLTHSVLNLLPDAPHLLATRRQRLQLAANASYTGSLATLGGGLLRTELHTTQSTYSHYALTSLSCPHTTQHHDVTLHTRLLGEHNTAVIRQRNLQQGTSHAVFQGKFHVEQAAQKTDAYMHNHTLLLSDSARTSTKPELEIYADDVKCSHGAAVGGLNAQQLFYLKARGLTEVAARALLVQGFADEFIAAFPPDAQPVLAARIAKWLHGEAAVPAQPTRFSNDWLAATKAAPEPRTVVREPNDDL